MKRDDLLSFAMGGNKVRKMQAVAAEAIAAGADTLITCGGLQSNHARVTAAAGAVLGLDVVLVLNGDPPARLAANTWLDRLFGAEIRFVPDRAARAPMMQAVAAERRGTGRRPFIVPLGASTATGALGFARGVAELAASPHRPDVIVSASSSAGTQAGLIAGTRLLGQNVRVIGVSADDPAPALTRDIDRLLGEIAVSLGAKPASIGQGEPIDVDDAFVGGGYGVPTPASTEALELVARTEGIVLDPVYTAKAMAGLVARVRDGRFSASQTVLFWHTGGVVGNFA
jgi:1-aminocyclopropane-1-carboxylate deaminase/D-cysteine desulfhydrase-like pyridoxal-dependent ACC family enzyme